MYTHDEYISAKSSFKRYFKPMKKERFSMLLNKVITMLYLYTYMCVHLHILLLLYYNFTKTKQYKLYKYVI